MSEEVYDLFAEDCIETRADELERKIRFHKDLYYNYPLDSRNIADDEYDAYEDELRSIRPDSEVLSLTGPPETSESPWDKGMHRIPMQSLDKINTPEQARKWMNSLYSSDLIVEEKLDGLSLSVDYEKGKLVRAVTRGKKGVEGDVITRNVVRMKGVRKVLPTRFTGSLRAECMMLEKDFEEVNRGLTSKGKSPLKNPRNAASGISRRLTGDGCDLLTVFFYEIIPEGGGLTFRTQQQKLTYIGRTLRLPTPGYVQLDAQTTIEKVYAHYEKGYRAKLPYGIDGLVLKLNMLSYAKKVNQAAGRGDTDNPKSQISLKFSNEVRISKVRDVSADFGLGGGVTPVAEVDPVSIGGSQITRASLSTWKRLESLKLYPGCPVLISKRNDIIPYLEKSLKDPGPNDVVFERQTGCPICGSRLQIRPKADGTKGKLWTCVNSKCPGIVAGKLAKWVKTLDVKHFGQQSVISKLLDSGEVSSISDLYKVTREVASEKCGAGIAKRAFENLHARTTVTLAELIGALSIRGVGVDTVQKVVDAGYDSLAKLREASESDLSAIDQIGPATAEAIVEGLRVETDELDSLDQVLTIVSGTTPAPMSSGPLQGEEICITGSLSVSKKVMRSLIEEGGGTWNGSVTKKTTLLIAEDPEGDSSKLTKARRNGVKIVSEKDFRDML